MQFSLLLLSQSRPATLGAWVGDNATACTGTVTTWPDSSGNSNTLTPHGSPTCTTNQINTHSAVTTVNASSQYFGLTSNIAYRHAGWEFYIVVKFNALGAKQTFTSSNNPTAGFVAAVDSSNHPVVELQNSAVVVTGTTTVPSGQYVLLEYVDDGTNICLYQNGASAGCATSASLSGNTGVDNLEANDSSGTKSEFPNASIAEQGIINNSTSRTALQAYTVAQYGLPTASFSISPTFVTTGSTGNVIVLTGTATAWTSTLPTFTISGVSASITGQSIISDTSATVTVSAGGSAGNATITDPSTSATAVLQVVTPQTWYIDPAGGTATRCTGHSPNPDPGSGSGQPCALAHDFWMMTTAMAWRSDFHGGDTVIHSASTFYMGQRNAGLGTDWAALGYTGCSASPPSFDCHLPVSMPSGSASFPTKWLGVNHGSCHNAGRFDTQGATVYTALNGTFYLISIQNTDYVDVECFKMIQPTVCTSAGNGTGHCNVGDNFAGHGIQFAYQTAQGPTNFTVKDITVEGMGSQGTLGSHFNRTTGDVSGMSDIFLRGNGSAGFDTDGGSCGTSCESIGTLNITYLYADFNGCVPAVSGDTLNATTHTAANGYNFCFDQTFTGNGDGVVLIASHDFHWSCDHCFARWNMQDGFDLLHLGDDITHHPVINISHSWSEGNEGQAYKVGTADTTAYSNVAIMNCRIATSPTIFPMTLNPWVTGSITAYSVTSNVITFTAANALTTGAPMLIYGFGTSAVFNNLRGLVLASGLSSTQFKMNLLAWAAATAFSDGQFIVDPNGNIQIVTSQGTSGATQPTWNLTNGGTTTDGGITWTNSGIGSGATEAGAFGTGYAVWLGNACRAGGDQWAITINNGRTVSLIHNSTFGYGTTMYDIICANTCTGTAALVFRDNMSVGYPDPGNSGQIAAGLFYDSINPFTQTGSAIDHNNWFNVRSNSGGGACPQDVTYETNYQCGDPLVLNELINTIDPHLTSLSTAVIGLGITGGSATDYYENLFKSPPSIGGVEYVTFSSLISGKVKIQGVVHLQ